MTSLQAVIFDMDGLLIDTEPVWRQAEIEVFARVGLDLTEEQCMQTMGVRVAQVVDRWYQRHPWVGPTCDEMTEAIEDAVILHVRERGTPMRGVHNALDVVRAEGLPMAIASSSSVRMIRAVIETLDIGEDIAVVASANDEAEGKPHPAVYLSAAGKLCVPRQACLALEDSPNGVVAAKAAGMICVSVPDVHLAHDPRMASADFRLASLDEFSAQTLDRARALLTASDNINS